jgi:putative lipase involved disintegration of autophagic bodies
VTDYRRQHKQTMRRLEQAQTLAEVLSLGGQAIAGLLSALFGLLTMAFGCGGVIVSAVLLAMMLLPIVAVVLVVILMFG